MERVPRLAVHGLQEFAKRFKKAEAEEAKTENVPPLLILLHKELR